MKLTEFMDHPDFINAIEAMVDPPSSKPAGKGSNPIAVHGYIVQGHWRRRHLPNRQKAQTGRLKLVEERRARL